MSKSSSAILSIGAAIAGSRFVRVISRLQLDDVLRPMGLSRRSSTWRENAVILGAGIAVGGVAALLLTPLTGEELRARVAKKVSALGEATPTNEAAPPVSPGSDSGARSNGEPAGEPPIHVL